MSNLQVFSPEGLTAVQEMIETAVQDSRINDAIPMRPDFGSLHDRTHL